MVAAVAAPDVLPLHDAIAAHVAAKGKVKLDLFVMSHCPFGVGAEKTLVPVLKQLGGRGELRVHYIAQVRPDGSFKSMHGPAEVAEDLRQVAMARLYPTQLPAYLVARTANYRSEDWQTAATAAGMKPQAVQSLATSPAGAQLLRADLQQVTALKISASPTLLLDGAVYHGPLQPPRRPGLHRRLWRDRGVGAAVARATGSH